MKYNFIYVFIFFILFYCIFSILSNSKKNSNNKENYKVESVMSKGQTSNNGPWGNIGTDRPWYDYPYILHNIEY